MAIGGAATVTVNYLDDLEGGHGEAVGGGDIGGEREASFICCVPLGLDRAGAHAVIYDGAVAAADAHKLVAELGVHAALGEVKGKGAVLRAADLVGSVESDNGNVLFRKLTAACTALFPILAVFAAPDTVGAAVHTLVPAGRALAPFVVVVGDDIACEVIPVAAAGLAAYRACAAVHCVVTLCCIADLSGLIAVLAVELRQILRASAARAGDIVRRSAHQRDKACCKAQRKYDAKHFLFHIRSSLVSPSLDSLNSYFISNI